MALIHFICLLFCSWEWEWLSTLNDLDRQNVMCASFFLYFSLTYYSHFGTWEFYWWLFCKIFCVELFLWLLFGDISLLQRVQEFFSLFLVQIHFIFCCDISSSWLETSSVFFFFIIFFLSSYFSTIWRLASASLGKDASSITRLIGLHPQQSKLKNKLLSSLWQDYPGERYE